MLETKQEVLMLSQLLGAPTVNPLLSSPGLIHRTSEHIQDRV